LATKDNIADPNMAAWAGTPLKNWANGKLDRYVLSFWYMF